MPEQTRRTRMDMKKGDIWFAATPGGDCPVLVLTCDPVAGRIGSTGVSNRGADDGGVSVVLAERLDDHRIS